MKKDSTIPQEMEPAFSTLSDISSELEALDEKTSDQEVKAALERAIEHYDLARKIALEQNQPWLAAWLDLQKVSLHCELAGMANSMGRAVQTHSAMELIKGVMEGVPDFPPDLGLAAKLYISMIDGLFRIRTLFEEPDQLEALDDLIRGVAENLGETQALDLSTRVDANDLRFCAGVLEVFSTIEEDPKSKAELLDTSRELSLQAADRLSISSPLEPVSSQEEI